jgi:hypothetical protein
MMRAHKKIIISIAISVFAFIAGFIASWLSSITMHEQRVTTPNKGKEVALVLSPNQLYQAKVWLPELDAMGATVSQPFQVWLENKVSNNHRRLVFEADKTDELRVRWDTQLGLEICYSDAQIHRFNNRFVSVDRKGGMAEARTVEIVLRRVKNIGDC